MKKMELKIKWLAEEKKSFEGWDFSYLDQRMVGSPLPWSYFDIVKQYLFDDMILLDMGTGGGEFLESLGHPYENIAVTEGYEPNYQLCLERLAPKGVRVEPVSDDGMLPFEDSSFDIVVNRHEHYLESEVYRVLKTGGIFITQQVGHENNVTFSKWILNNPDWTYACDNFYPNTLTTLKELGFKVMAHGEAFLPLKFLDVGALVYFMKIIQWEFPNFSVEEHFDQLMTANEIIEKDGFVESEEHRYFIVCKK